MKQRRTVERAQPDGYSPHVLHADTMPPEEPRADIPPDERLTPAMRQYWEQKQAVGDALLLFRMGDFYELFYRDAEDAARLLGIALTSRDGGRTPLAGIPYHALESYLAKLVAAGRRVAISEQIEDAAQAKGVVKRAVTRIVTPGTLTDDALLDRLRSNTLAAIVVSGTTAGLAWLELSTGEFEVQLCAAEDALHEISRIAPSELLLPEPATAGRDPLEVSAREQFDLAVSYRPPTDFGASRAEQTLVEHFGTLSLEGFGFSAMDPSLQAAGALLAYVRETQRDAVRHLRPPRRRELNQFVALDAVTLRSLEVERTLRSGARSGSLLGAMDGARNPMGARLLRQWLCYPLRDLDAIRRRQRLLAALREAPGARARVRLLLGEMADIERIIGRLGVQRTHPRELRSLGDALSRLPGLIHCLRELRMEEAESLAAELQGLDDLATRLCASLTPDAPAVLREGGIFQAGVHAELDRLRAIHRDGQQWLASYQAGEAQRTGIPSLKVGFNKVFGYYIEITNPHRDKAPENYVRKQTVKNAERYITDELKRYEADALSAESRACALEYELFSALRESVMPRICALQRAARALAELDVLAGWAELSATRGYCSPELTSEPVLEIVEGRHPVVELSLDRGFVANDVRLAGRSRDDAEPREEPPPPSLALITGPNMAGKSTYIRQVALLTLLAHCGADVPAKRMRVGLVDRIFTRVGAADELSRGQSTFMVEMLETANILHNATARSLVILDEIGRGTSTFDGLALAWAVAEHLATGVGVRALFATHYHELTELAELLDGVANLNVAVREYEDQIVFLHRISPGPADRSYGLHVAKLAGVPHVVLERANAVLNELERTFDRQAQRPALAAMQRRRQRQLRLFEEPEEQVIRELRQLPEELDSHAALEWLSKWRRMLKPQP